MSTLNLTPSDFDQVLHEQAKRRPLESSPRTQQDDTNSLEAQIMNAMMRCSLSVQNGRLRTQYLTAAVNKNRLQREHYTVSYIARRTHAMGFRKTKTAEGHSAIFYERHMILKNTERLRLLLSVTHYTPSPPFYDEPNFIYQ